MGSSGYVNYAYGLLNTSEDTLVEWPSVQIVGYDAAGNVLFTDDRDPVICLPGQTTYVTGMSDCAGTKPDRVEFTLKNSAATRTRQVTEPVTFSVSAVNVRKGDYGDATFTGTFDIKGTQEALSGLSKYAAATSITVILRDDLGNIVYGYNTYQYSLNVGDNQPYSVSCTGLPAFATAEVYVYPS